MLSRSPFTKKDSKERVKRQARLRYYIKKALLERLGRKYNNLYMCPGCFKRKKLRVYRINKNHNPPGESDYVLLCATCIKCKQEGRKKPKLWSRKPGKGDGSSKQTFLNSIRAEVFTRDRAECPYCGSTEKLGLGPIRPESKGGERSIFNYTVCCLRCRAGKGDKLPLDFLWTNEEAINYWLHEQLDYNEVVATPVPQRVNLLLIAEISQFLMRIATNENIEGKTRNKAERLNIKLSETDEDRRRQRRAEGAEMRTWIR